MVDVSQGEIGELPGIVGPPTPNHNDCDDGDNEVITDRSRPNAGAGGLHNGDKESINDGESERDDDRNDQG